MTKSSIKGKLSFKSNSEKSTEDKILKNLLSKKIPNDELLENLGMFLSSKNLSRILCLNYLYRKQIKINGNIFDFGTRWGQNATLFSTLRGIYEPFNRHKRVFAFDTFSGFNKINKKDGKSNLMKIGNLKTTQDYPKFLQSHLDQMDSLNPISHIKKNMVYKGDSPKMLKELLKKNQETIVSLAYFDFDVYEPTLKCLELLKPRFVKGTVLAFDELNDQDSPGETLALMKSIGLNNIRLERFKYASRISYCIF